MQSTHKIAGGDTEGFAEYLTSVSARGDYYIDGEERHADGGGDGRWHGSPAALGALGLSAERPVQREQLLALMQGRSPLSGDPIRNAGGDGTRVAGIDMTFSAPKSVSALWALSSPYRRAQIEAAHRAAVASALERVRRDVELVRCRRDGVLEWEHARSLLAAEFLHTASRLTRAQERDGVPDPQLHSHLVVLAAQRQDGRFAAVDSRELFRSARANGAWYRAELAASLRALGLGVQRRTGRDGRYFELGGVPSALSEHWSTRGAEIEQAFREFRRRYGRDPRAGELSSIAVATRGTKTVARPLDLDACWRAVGQEHGLSPEQADALFADRELERRAGHQSAPESVLAAELPVDLTARASMVSERDLRARAYELATGVCRPEQAREVLDGLERSGELLRLEGGMWTTRQLRETEQRTLQRVGARAQERAAPVSERSLEQASEEAEREIEGQLSVEQQAALRRITGPGGVSVLVGQAGTGKGVVIRTAADAWRREGYTVLGTAVAGATAERLAGEAKLDRSFTADSLIASAEHGRLTLDRKSVLVMDEVGMADTRRLARVSEIAAESESKLVLVGDSAQLSPIGAGGLFDQLEQRAPSAELTEIRRARNEWERDAWRQLRDGDAHEALATYQAHERLHISDTREQAAQQMVRAWDRARQEVGEEQAVMLTDASNAELDRINQLAQQARDQHGELGRRRVQFNDRPYALAAGDRVIFTASHPQPGDRRVENGTTGTVRDIGKDGRLTIETSGPNARRVEVDPGEFQALKLAYAQHVYKGQGLTCERAQVLLGGWQTDRERAYVALSRARERTDIHLARADLGEQGLDAGAIQRLGEQIAHSNAQQASISRQRQPRERPADVPVQPSSDRERSENLRDRSHDAAGREAEPLSEVGRISREQEAREREAERDQGLGFGFD